VKSQDVHKHVIEDRYTEVLYVAQGDAVSGDFFCGRERRDHSVSEPLVCPRGVRSLDMHRHV